MDSCEYLIVVTSFGSYNFIISIAMSSDGTIMAAVVGSDNIWISEDSGVTWIEDTSVGNTKEWTSVAISSDGSKIVATTEKGEIWSITLG